MEERDEEIEEIIPYRCEAEPRVIIEVAGRKWRVTKDASETEPVSYLSAYTSTGIRSFNGNPVFCVRCGMRGKRHSVWTPFADVLCRSCMKLGEVEKYQPFCPYCGMEMDILLPFELPSLGLRFVWVCLLHHCFVIGSEEGICGR